MESTTVNPSSLALTCGMLEMVSAARPCRPAVFARHGADSQSQTKPVNHTLHRVSIAKPTTTTTAAAVTAPVKETPGDWYYSYLSVASDI